MSDVESQIAMAFRCRKCDQHGASVENLAMSGTGFSRIFEVQPYRYAFASCKNCGFTEIYNLDTLDGKDDLGKLLEVIFAD